MDSAHESGATASPVSSVVNRNIEALMASRRDADSQKSTQERVSEAVTSFAGSMWFVYVHAALFGGWLVWNWGWVPGVRAFDQGFAGVAIIASIEAMFLSTFVLINQKRMQARELRRSELDLQISLLAEHEVTQLAELLEAVARKVGVQDEELPDIEETKQHVEPTLVLEAIHEQEARV